ncbi:hypothetical protein [Lysinibacillus xylanilyticus]|uniref:hypothetical protein n=1 Tax=Lysinibacillus xylanilyticus TaxID=582475 RepID=UPI0036DAF14E
MGIDIWSINTREGDAFNGDLAAEVIRFEAQSMMPQKLPFRSLLKWVYNYLSRIQIFNRAKEKWEL